MAALAVLAAATTYSRNRPAPIPDNAVHVSGKVRFQGQPLVLGLVIFEPDPRKGASGPQGYAHIKDGQFDTKLGGKPASIGACIARITGGDGQGVLEALTPFGNLLFEEYSSDITIDKSAPVLEFNITGSQ